MQKQSKSARSLKLQVKESPDMRSATDRLGSYTGTPTDKYTDEVPVQDADDL